MFTLLAFQFTDRRFSRCDTLWMSNFPLPVSTPLSATSMTSLSATSTTRAVSTAGTSSTTEFTAASISSLHSATGESWHTKTFLSHTSTEIWRLSLTWCPCASCAISLKPLDVQFMKAIHNKVNVVPVIAKADTLTLKERERLKRRVSARLGYCLGIFSSSWTERLLSHTHSLYSKIHCPNKKFSIWWELISGSWRII